jgi:anti-sigma factor RsiW
VPGRLGHRLRFRRDHRWTQRHASDYLDDDLAPEARRRVEHHRGECPECDALLEALRSMVVALGGMRGPAGSGVAAAVLAGVREELGGGHDRPH